MQLSSHTKQKHSGYFEAIFQLRDCSSKVFEYVGKQIEKQNISISKQVDQKNGVDLYLSSWRFAVALAKKLKKTFRGETKITRKLFGVDRQKGKRVYRVTVLFRGHRI